MAINGYLGGVISATAPSVTTAGASGVFTLEEQLQAAGQNNWPGYQISRSVRLRSSASAYFSWTPSVSATSTQKLTYSAWVKRGTLGSVQFFGLTGAVSGASRDAIRFTTSNALEIFLNEASSCYLATTQLFRDPSAWYHIVVAVDTTQATSSDRIKVYVNGVQVTAFSTSTYPAQNYNFTGWLVSGKAQNLGRSPEPNYYFDGYMTEVNVVDGQQLTPSSFGSFDAVTGVWNPIRYTGTYGNNGFYLNYSDNSAATATTIGKDYSGNGNNWTPNNISVTAGTTYDSMVDVPIGYGSDTGVGGELRGNYATLNPLNSQSNLTLSGANLNTSTPAVGTWRSVVGTVAMTSGKWYWEATAGANGAANHYFVGIAATSFNALTDNVFLGSTTDSWSYYGNNGTKYNNSSSAAYGASYTTNDVIGIAYDADAGTLTFYKNGTSQGTAFTGLSGAMVAGTSGYNGSGMYHNFGQRAFSYTAPSGFKALCTQNLPTPTVSNGANYMAATTYSGSGASQTIANTVNGVSFRPDMVWIKSRSNATDHQVFDVVRGGTPPYRLLTNSTAAEYSTATGYVGTTSTGISLDSSGGGGGDTNTSGRTYVGWQWKGGGTAVSNTAGTITSSVSANTTAGFSVVTYTGTGANATVGHGLGIAPSLLIVKERNTIRDWPVWHSGILGTQFLSLNSTDAIQTVAAVWNSTIPTSTVFSVGTNAATNQSTGTYVAYCFAPISGYSAFGSYTGNGSTDGPFIYCGFRPRFVLMKIYTSTTHWVIIDSSRDTYNVASLRLCPNLALDEATLTDPTCDFVSNGFKIRTTTATSNTSGQSYIYAAFAENPFNISRAR